MKLRIAIIGTRGIPNYYGGFEQAAQFIGEGLAKKGHAVTVYNSYTHPYKEKSWRRIKIVHCKDPENWMGSFGQFLYDLNCIRHARKQQFDIWLFFGYTSSSIWRKWYSRKAVIIYNMDGLEWKRSKYSKPVQKFLQYAEKLAIKYSDAHIADSVAIQSYLNNKYPISSEYIPYGADISEGENKPLPADLAVTNKKYFMLMARMEPENNVEIILKGFSNSNSENKFLVVGNTKTKHGKKLLEKFKNDDRIVFTGGIFDKDTIRTLRKYCIAYFHGHSVGGTNPSLLEAMADKPLIVAHNNPFNQAVLGNDAFYFSNANDIKQIIEKPQMIEDANARITRNFQKIKEIYNWEKVIEQYESFIMRSYILKNQ